jgi:hypothetical protein
MLRCDDQGTIQALAGFTRATRRQQEAGLHGLDHRRHRVEFAGVSQVIEAFVDTALRGLYASSASGFRIVGGAALPKAIVG